MSNVEPKEGMPVEHGNGGKSAEKLVVTKVNTEKKTFHLDTPSGDPYTVEPGQFKDLEPRLSMSVYGRSEYEQGVISAAIEYIKLRDQGHQHTSPEGKKLNDAVKAYLRAVQSR